MERGETGQTGEASNLHKYVRTGLVTITCAIMGMHVNLLGPSLLDIAYFTGSTIESTTLLFTCNFTGYLLTSLFLRPVIDRINAYFLIAISFVGMAVAVGVTPWWRHIAVFYVTFTIGGMFTCLTTINLVSAIVLIWGPQADPYQQAAFFARSVGTALAPQIFKPFLMSTGGLNSNHSKELTDGNIGNQTIGALATYVGQPNNIDVAENNTNAFGIIPESKFQYGYLIISIAFLCASIIHFIIFFYDGATIRRSSKGTSTSLEHLNKITGKPKIIAHILQIALGFFLGSVEECFAGLIMAFLIKYLGWTEQIASDMNTVFFAASASSRLLGIPLAKFMKASHILGIQSLLIFMGYLVFSLAVHLHWIIPWVGAILVGFGFGSSYASLINWSNTYMDITGSNASLFYISFGLGGLASPPFMAYLCEVYSPVWFMYIGLIYAISLIVVYIVKFIFISYMLSKHSAYYKSEETEVNMSLNAKETSPSTK